ncbi:MAG: hypothetical protein EP348_12400, partial [Alphaproteobacteria bacterium]
RFSGISLPSHLAERYQDEMTIVLQHQFWNVVVEPDYFSVDLSFNHKRETLTIPFAALTAFADPSVQFGLQFSPAPAEQGTTEAVEELIQGSKPEEESAKDASDKQGEVIALDAFRKK